MTRSNDQMFEQELDLDDAEGLHIVVVGGGTATNAIVPVYADVASTIAYIVPISDNGGSTSEILRVLGGPAIGDARSRVVRLIPHTPLRDLLEHRLPECEEEAHAAWQAIVEGVHPLWTPIPIHLRNMYRSFFVHVSSEILRRGRPVNAFKFTHASVGNLLISGARLFFGSLDSAIEFVLRTARASPRYAVLPALSTHFSYHIAAELQNGDIIVGQTQISHPSNEAEVAMDRLAVDENECEEDIPEDATVPFSHPSLNSSQISFSKLTQTALASPIERVYYVNPYGAEIKPTALLRVRKSLKAAKLLVYSIGSLYTSIIPVISLGGFSSAASNIPNKVLILNGYQDRETEGMKASDFVNAIVQAGQYSFGSSKSNNYFDYRQYLTHIIYGEPKRVVHSHAHVHMPPSEVRAPSLLQSQNGSGRESSSLRTAVGVDIATIANYGIKCVPVPCDPESLEYDTEYLKLALRQIAGTRAGSEASRGIHSADLLAFAYPNSDC